jgi:hypothetical protein
MSLIARAAWRALGFQVRDESPMLRLAVHLRVAVGFNAARVAARVQQAICRRLRSAEVVVRAVAQ